MTTSESEGRLRTAPARAARKRNAEERKASELESRGWVCVPPEVAGRARVVLMRHSAYLRDGESAR